MLSTNKSTGSTLECNKCQHAKHTWIAVDRSSSLEIPRHPRIGPICRWKGPSLTYPDFAVPQNFSCKRLGAFQTLSDWPSTFAHLAYKSKI